MLIPFAVQSNNRMRERGPYAGGMGPRGAVVHFTAGHYEQGINNAINAIEGGIKKGYTYLCIASTGELVQAHDVMQWGYHAGESAWKLPIKRATWKILGSVSDDLIGIEMNCAGRLTKVGDELFPWWAFKNGKLMLNAKPIPASEGRFISSTMAKEWGCPSGWYHKYTPEQEETLIKTLLWLYLNVEPFKIDAILGHHEVSGLLGLGYWRKNDPGGSLSMPMKQFRAYLDESKQELCIKYGIRKL